MANVYDAQAGADRLVAGATFVYVTTGQKEELLRLVGALASDLMVSDTRVVGGHAAVMVQHPGRMRREVARLNALPPPGPDELEREA